MLSTCFPTSLVLFTLSNLTESPIEEPEREHGATDEQQKASVRVDLVTIEELKRVYDVTDEQLDTNVRQKDFYDLAGCFDCVETYLDKLGLTAGQQTQVEDLAVRRDVQTAMTKALKFWHQPKPWMATFRTLLQISLDRRRGDVAERLCLYIKQEIPKPKPKKL